MSICSITHFPNSQFIPCACGSFKVGEGSISPIEIGVHVIGQLFEGEGHHDILGDVLCSCFKPPNTLIFFDLDMVFAEMVATHIRNLNIDLNVGIYLEHDDEGVPCTDGHVMLEVKNTK